MILLPSETLFKFEMMAFWHSTYTSSITDLTISVNELLCICVSLSLSVEEST